MKKLCILLLIICSSALFVSCKGSTKNTASEGSKLPVTVTFNALEELTSAVGKDKVSITTIIPAGTEPHDFEPKAADIAGITNGKVFVENGLGMETWAEDALNAANNKKLVVITASDGADAISNTGKDEIEEHGAYDPHLWLSLKGAELEVQNIADGLSKADPDNQSYYQANAKAYNKQLEDLYQEYSAKFSALTNKNFVTGHAAFNYFCRDFNLTQNSVEDVFAEGEPSTKQLAKLVDYCKANHVATIFAEEMASPEISKTLADEVGAEVETIYTIEGPEDNLSYYDRMKDNCERIYQSLSKEK